MTRTKQDHFSPEEIAFIEQSFQAGENTSYVAAMLKCSRRVVQIRYADLRGERYQRPSRAKKIVRERRIPTPNFYHSTFDLAAPPQS